MATATCAWLTVRERTGVAQITAGGSFTHDIKRQRQQHTGHLVTHGIYR
jgi:hypothetical protein